MISETGCGGYDRRTPFVIVAKLRHVPYFHSRDEIRVCTPDPDGRDQESEGQINIILPPFLPGVSIGGMVERVVQRPAK